MASISAAAVALVVLVDGVDQRRGGGRRVALQHDARAVVQRGAQRGKRFLVLPLAVVAVELQGPRACGNAGQPDAAARVHALHRPQQVAEHGLSSVGEGSAHAFDEGKADGCGRC